MNEQEALTILAQAAQLAHMPAQAHAQCQQAANVLLGAITPKEAPVENKEAKDGKK